MGMFDFITNPVASLMGGAMGLFGQSQTNDMQKDMMQQQQSFQQQMSSTAYQRASTDMQAAGLNPMMMFGSGSAASTPSGAAPSASVKSGFDSDSMQRVLSSATQQRVANATIDNLVEQNAKIKAETLTEGRRPGLLSSQSVATERAGELDAANTYKTRESIPITQSDAQRAKNEMSMEPGARQLLDVGGYAGRKAADIVSPIGSTVSSAVRALSSKKRPITNNYYN